MKRISPFLSLLIAACSCPDDEADAAVDSAMQDSATPDSASMDAGMDAGMDAFDASAGDATMLSDVRPDTPPPGGACVGEMATLSGNAFGSAFDFPFVMVGVEPDRAKSCPRLFVRAGESADFTLPLEGSYFELDIPYARNGAAPGVAMGTITWAFEGQAPLMEEIMVNVTRADGLFENDIPFEERRVEFTIAHHDATTDFDAAASVSAYCLNFPMCI